MISPNQLHAAGLPVFPVNAKKRPSVKGWQQPLAPEQYHWPVKKLGIPIPAGVFVVDLDTYKGVTRQQVEQLLGCPLPWDAALMQRTQSGGEHYAFAYNGPELMQGADLLKLKGFDSRRAGAGFIVSGEGYTQEGFGVYRMAQPASLPPLPMQAAQRLMKPEREASAPLRPATEDDKRNAVEALKHIDPDCSRDEWVRVGMSLKVLFREDVESGHEIFQSWSAGEYHDEIPVGYVDYDDVEHQFDSFKTDAGGIGPGTIFYKAIENGWQPPAQFDTAAVFGQGAASADEYSTMVDDIRAYAGEESRTPELIKQVREFAGSADQKACLVALMERALKDSGLLTKEVRDGLRSAAAATTTSKVTAEASGLAVLPPITELDQVPDRKLSRASAVHGSNAAIMLSEVFGGRLAAFDGSLRWWTGAEWQAADEPTLNRLTSSALSPEHDKMPNVNGTVAALPLKADRRKAADRDRHVYFKNGVLDMETGLLAPHNQDNNNLSTLSVNYEPHAPRGEWDAHMERLFRGLPDGEQRVELLQEIVGWLLISDDLNAQKMIAFDGATRAGKGVILEALAAILGPGKLGLADFAYLANGKTQSAFRSHDVMFDFDAKPPMRQESKLALGFALKVASNEPVSIQLLNTQTPWTGRLNSKYLISCNGIPVMMDDSGASSTRFMILRFDRSFEGQEDPGITARMMQYLPGVAAWGVQGLRRLIANNGRFTMPPSSEQAIADLKSGNQPLREFVDEYCKVGQGERCHAKDLWFAYSQYCNAANVKKSSRGQFLTSFRMMLLAAGVQDKKSVRVDGLVSTGFEGVSVEMRDPGNVVAGEFGRKAQ